MTLMKHINALNMTARYFERAQGTGLSPAELSNLLAQAQAQRAKRAADRWGRYYRRNMGYPYSSKRQLGRHGVNAVCYSRPQRPINPLHWSGRIFGGLHA